MNNQSIKTLAKHEFGLRNGSKAIFAEHYMFAKHVSQQALDERYSLSSAVIFGCTYLEAITQRLIELFFETKQGFDLSKLPLRKQRNQADRIKWAVFLGIMKYEVSLCCNKLYSLRNKVAHDPFHEIGQDEIRALRTLLLNATLISDKEGETIYSLTNPMGVGLGFGIRKNCDYVWALLEQLDNSLSLNAMRLGKNIFDWSVFWELQTPDKGSHPE